MLNLKVGNKSADGSIEIVAEDKFCYQVFSSSHGGKGIRTISKKLVEEYVNYLEKNPDATSQNARDSLCGKSEIDKFEYGYTATLLNLARINNTAKEKELSNFKHLLEYYCAHLHFIVTNDNSIKGYDEYLKPFIDAGTFKKSGQGWKGQSIQKQIEKWEQYSAGKVCINVYGNSFQSYATYLHWNTTSHNISANWNKNQIDSLQCVEYYSYPKSRWEQQSIKFTLDELGLYDGNKPNENVRMLFEAFERMLQVAPKENDYAPERSSQYRSYITAIKSKPFLLLAGISGTGKSRIVRELARACWDEGSDEFKAHKPSNFEMVQVKPNWHDSSELIGYVSRVSGEPVFVAGDFLKFVAKAWENPDVPYFLCLDEMNLAPVEQYFAEYLSVVESRKLDGDKVVTDPILKKETEQWYFDLVRKLTENGNVQERFNADGICIPQNLIVVGTVNMDETTFSFSRKVLDRAMTIEMNEVNLNGGLDNRYELIGKLGAAELIGNAVEGVDVYKAYKDVCDKVISYLKEVNGVLEGTPFKIAYRTRNEFLLYVVNNLPYNKDKDGKELKEGFVIARALDEITSMKILSRIEGDESKVKENLLTQLRETIKDELHEISDKGWAAKETENEYKSVSLAKLEEMIARLKTSGYTSFWS